MALTVFLIFLYNLKGNLSGSLRKEFQVPMVSIERDYHFQSDVYISVKMIHKG